MNVRTLSAGAAVALLCLSLIACGSKVKGNTYDAGVISIAFQSGGKATFSTPGNSELCTYTEGSGKVNVTCNGETNVFTLDSDGNLNGPPGSFIPKMIKRK